MWTGGFLSRHGNFATPPFPKHPGQRISQLRAATFQLKKAALGDSESCREKGAFCAGKSTAEVKPEVEVEVVESISNPLLPGSRPPTTTINLGIEPSAKVQVIRKAYFRLAKQLHPDRYHSESPELLARIESAFTELAQAHETLKNNDSRQGYDIRMRQAQRDKEAGPASSGESSRQEEQAAKDFERGFDLQLNGDLEEALPYLPRAAHYSPHNARYHAYYGKALAADENQRHKAENELATAIRLDPQNDSFRLMMAEFFIRYKLLKRAEGELKRLIASSPDNRQARALLDSLAVK